MNRFQIFKKNPSQGPEFNKCEVCGNALDTHAEFADATHAVVLHMVLFDYYGQY